MRQVCQRHKDLDGSVGMPSNCVRGVHLNGLLLAVQGRRLAWRMGSSFSLGFLGMKEVQSAMTSAASTTCARQ